MVEQRKFCLNREICIMYMLYKYKTRQKHIKLIFHSRPHNIRVTYILLYTTTDTCTRIFRIIKKIQFSARHTYSIYVSPHIHMYVHTNTQHIFIYLFIYLFFVILKALTSSINLADRYVRSAVFCA